MLRAEVAASAAAAEAAGVRIVSGDTKVVERGHCDGMYITTTGIGRVDPRAALSPANLRPGDRVLVSGPIGEHGTAIMLARDEFELDADVTSDTQPLWAAADALLAAAGEGLRCMRDATRGGVATVLNELARASGVAIVAREGDVPVRPDVMGAAEILGIDPMYIANEGRLVAFVAPDRAEAALAALRGGGGQRRRRRDRRGQDRAPRHGPRRDRLRRQARDGPAGRRPTAENLLMRRAATTTIDPAYDAWRDPTKPDAKRRVSSDVSNPRPEES